MFCTIWQLDYNIAHANHFELLAIHSCDAPIMDWVVVGKHIAVRAVVVTSSAINACTKSQFGDVECISDVSIVGGAGEHKQVVCIVSCVGYHCHLWPLLPL